MLFGSKEDKIAKIIAKGNEDGLLKFLTDKDEKIRVAAIDGLAKVTSTRASFPLIDQLKDPSPVIRAHTATALGAIGDPHTKEFILQAIQTEKDPDALAAMKASLGKIKNY